VKSQHSVHVHIVGGKISMHKKSGDLAQ